MRPTIELAHATLIKAGFTEDQARHLIYDDLPREVPPWVDPAEDSNNGGKARTVRCSFCGESFTSRRPTTLYCDTSCRRAAERAS